MRFLTLLLLFTTSLLFAQNVSTISAGNPDDDILVDQDGTLYVSQFFGGNIIKYSPDGQASLFKSGLQSANGLAFDNSNQIYVCDFMAEEIVVLDSDANVINSFPINGNPSGIIKDLNSEDMIFTNYSQNTINRLSPDGNITLMNSNAELNGPVGLTRDEEGHLYVNNFNDATVFEVLQNDELRYIATLPSEGQLPYLGFIKYGKGKLWATMLQTHKVYTIQPDDTDNFTLFAGSTSGNQDGAISEATFNAPNGLAFSNDSTTLYITDSGSSNLRLITDIPLSTTNTPKHTLAFEVFPNPTSNELHFQKPKNLKGEFQVQILKSTGEMVSTFRGNSIGFDDIVYLDISNIATGNYVIRLDFNSQNFTSSFSKI